MKEELERNQTIIEEQAVYFLASFLHLYFFVSSFLK